MTSLPAREGGELRRLEQHDAARSRAHQPLLPEAWRKALSLYGEARIERSEVCAYVEGGDLAFPPEYELRPAPPPPGSGMPSGTTH